ncbi:MAG: hypothetical protein KDC92_15550 [Bacteroidetes bacterium]|nr:hypothetical protein [Bacteroidota bacterium]
MKIREHIQKYSGNFEKVSTEYYDLLEQVEYSEDLSIEELTNIENGLKQIIALEPDYLDPYLLLYKVNMFEGKLLDADQILDNAYQKSLHLIIDAKGHWPDLMEWGWQENRPIIRTLMQKAENLWIDALEVPGLEEEAQEIYGHLLRVNPGDNTAARYPLLALLKGMDYGEYESGFLVRDEEMGLVFSEDCETWFAKESKKYPEFAAWRTYMKQIS